MFHQFDYWALKMTKEKKKKQSAMLLFFCVDTSMLEENAGYNMEWLCDATPGTDWTSLYMNRMWFVCWDINMTIKVFFFFLSVSQLWLSVFNWRAPIRVNAARSPDTSLQINMLVIKFYSKKKKKKNSFKIWACIMFNYNSKNIHGIFFF